MPIPGDPDALLAASQELTVAAKSLQTAREGMAARGRLITANWSGRAAPAALEVIERHATDLDRAVEAVVRSASPLATYAEELRAAQQDYARGEQMLQNSERPLATVGSGAPAAADTARDIAERGREEAIAVMADAKERAFRANEVAARAVAEAGAGLESIVPVQPSAPVVGDSGPDVGGFLTELGNTAVSFGNAALQDPSAIATVVGGAGLIALGTGGQVGGLALDVTGVGVPAGIGAHVVSGGLIATGAGLVGVGAMSVAQSASGEGRVEPFGSSGGGGGTTPAATRPTVIDPKLNNIVDDLYRGTRSANRTGDGTTAAAVRSERATGQPVQDKFHTEKANNMVRSLRAWLRRNRNASVEDRQIAQREYDNLLDALGRTP